VGQCADLGVGVGGADVALHHRQVLVVAIGALERAFSGATRVHVEHQGGGQRLQLSCFQGLTEGVSPLGANPAGAAVVGERPKWRLAVHRQHLADGDAVPQPPPVNLHPAAQEGTNHILADAILLLKPPPLQITGAAPADRPGRAPGLGIGVGREPAALELLN
jgi:hypothetical protein